MSFIEHAVDNPGAVECPRCRTMVALPRTEPHLVAGGQMFAPQLVSIRCPRCRTRIYLQEVSDEERARDAEEDGLRDRRRLPD